MVANRISENLEKSRLERETKEFEQKEKTEFQYEWFVGPGIKESKLNENGNKVMFKLLISIIC